MNGVSIITDKILSDANAWAQEQIDASQAAAGEQKKEYAATAAAQSKEILEQAQAKAQAVEERARSQAEMDRRKSILAAKQAAVGQAFDAALKQLSSMSEEERVLLMVRMVLKYQTEDAQLIFNAADQKSVGPAVVSTVNSIYTRQMIKETFSGSFLEQVKKLVRDEAVKLSVTLSNQVGSFAGGFILKQGDVEQNCTFEILVSSLHDELEGPVSNILFQ